MFLEEDPMDAEHEQWLNEICYACGQRRRYCRASGIYQQDPADDGQEVDIIRREMQIAAGVSLHWTDRDGHVLCPPMTTDEDSRKGIQL